jgi:hypothetical protein
VLCINTARSGKISARQVAPQYTTEAAAGLWEVAGSAAYPACTCEIRSTEPEGHASSSAGAQQSEADLDQHDYAGRAVCGEADLNPHSSDDALSNGALRRATPLL